MVEMDVVYEGDLHCRARHGPSGAEIVTDAPKDNEGRGEAFSPTDLLATSLGVCMMTLMGIYARRHGIRLDGSRGRVVKEMVADPLRRVGRLAVAFDLPGGIAAEHRAALERAALTCPVHRSLRPEVKIDVDFRWSGLKAA